MAVAALPYLQGTSGIARPLHELTKKNQRFQWTDRQETALCSLKRKLTEAPVLASLRDEGIYVLDIDVVIMPWEPQSNSDGTENFV